VSPFDTYILESDGITARGSWSPSWSTSARRRISSISLQVHRQGWPDALAMLCSELRLRGWPAGWRPNPPGSRYGMCLQQIRLTSTDERSRRALHSEDNIAVQATVTVSSTHSGYSAGGAVDGVVGGFPGDTSREWATSGESDTAMIRLTGRRSRPLTASGCSTGPTRLIRSRRGW